MYLFAVLFYQFCGSLTCFLLLVYFAPLCSHSVPHMQVKKHIKKGKSVSMGFGFIELDSVDTAINVCRDLQVIPKVSAKFKLLRECFSFSFEFSFSFCRELF